MSAESKHGGGAGGPAGEEDHSFAEEAAEIIEEHPRLLGLGITIVAVIVFGLIVLAVEPLRESVELALRGDTEALRDKLRGVTGVTLTMFLALAHSVVFYPAEILNAAVGFVYGFWVGLGLIMIGWAANAYVAYQIGAHAGRPVVSRLLGRERLERYERLIERGGVQLLLITRIIPIVPFSGFSMVLGAARVPLFQFMWTSTVGYIPLTALFVYLGSRLEEISPTDPAVLGVVGIFALLILLARPAARRFGVEPGD